MKINGLVATLLLVMFNLVAAVQPIVKYNNNSAEYSIQWEKQFAQINNLSPEIEINDKWISMSEFKSIKWEKRDGNRLSEKNKYSGKVEYLYLICENHPLISKFTIEFELMEDRPYLVMNASLQVDKKIKLGGIRLFNSAKENIVLPGESKDWIIFNESASAPHVGALMYPYQLNTKKAKQGSFSKADTGVWLSMLVNDSKNCAFSFASISGELWPNNFKWELPVENDVNKLKVSARSGAIDEKEKIWVPAGKTITTDAFIVGFWENQRPTKTLLETGEIIGENVRKGKPMHCPEPGWSSWHSYDRRITEKQFLITTDFINQNLKEYGWKTLQIDGGWWTDQGLYAVNDSFPHGIRYLSNYVTERELDFGLHVSPLRTNTTDPVVKRHPDWILRPITSKKVDKSDEEMVTTLGTVYVDGSHPEVPAFLAGRYQQLVEGYKPSFMKWDHHYGALEEGNRYDSTMTFLQAHNITIRAIRSALPDDLIITRSMGYLFGALECYDAIRIGQDINRPGIKSAEEPYTNITYGKTLGTIEDDQVEKGLIRFARQAAQNFYTHKNIAICDPDAFFVSPQYTINEAKCHMTLEAIMGGLFFFGDKVESLPAERLELLKNKDIIAVNKLGVHAIPLDLFTGVDIPTIWKLETKDRLIITVFNWLDNEVTKTYNLKTDFELNNSKYKLTELWTKKNFDLIANKLTLIQPAHSVKILEFEKL
ncbi:MAG: alpha-galactosidase [Bacteroidia bacterium]|nr:alpha-galactosidase [Bacteroidia bacterium]